MNTPAPPLSAPLPVCAPATQTGTVAFLGNYPPRQCGIATFTHDLCEHYARAFPATSPVALCMTDHERHYDYPSRVALDINEARPEDYHRAADYLNRLPATVLSLQHEYGIFGGTDGTLLSHFLERCQVPVVTTLHTVLENPTPSQREITSLLLAKSAQVVVMAEKARQLLLDNYPVDNAHINVIPHGIPGRCFLSSQPQKERMGFGDRPVILTFGLIGPGKGLEHGIRAMRNVTDRHPDALYLILGATHPHLLQAEGERYRHSLEELVGNLGLSDNVRFIDKYATLEELTDYLGATDLYLTPYQSEAQITSGTLAYASGCGCPVVSTPYWHAQELITPDRGVLVPFNNSCAIGEALSELINSPARREAMRRAAVQAGRSTRWSEVVKQYAAVFAKAAATSTPAPFQVVRSHTDTARPGHLRRLDHLVRMTDRVGIWQHARYRRPNREHGYCVDDNARALLLTAYRTTLGREEAVPLHDYAGTFLKFLTDSLNPANQRFRNFRSAEGAWMEEAGSDDSHGRTLWALGEVLRLDPFPSLRPKVQILFEKGLGAVGTLRAPRSWAFTLLGLDAALESSPHHARTATLHRMLKDHLARSFTTNANSAWPWPEETLTYGNARLPHALLLAAQRCEDVFSRDMSLAALEWLMKVQLDDNGNFRPIGNRGWHSRSSREPAPFDQQPIEAHASVSACLAAWRITGQEEWHRLAQHAFQWFLGANCLGLPLLDATNGGCHDGLQPDGLNQNQGAESLLAFHLSLAELELAEREMARQAPSAPGRPSEHPGVPAPSPARPAALQPSAANQAR